MMIKEHNPHSVLDNMMNAVQDQQINAATPRRALKNTEMRHLSSFIWLTAKQRKLFGIVLVLAPTVS